MNAKLFLTGLALSIGLTVQAEQKVVNVEKSGSLSALLTAEEQEKLTDLKVTGTLSGEDIQVLRTMGGGMNYWNVIDEKKDKREYVRIGSLERLDLSDATLKGEGSYLLHHYGGEKVQMEDDVIGRGMFQMCENLVSVKLPKSAVRVDMNALYGCGNLKEYELPEVEHLESIFQGCNSLEKVVLPASVKSLGYAFFCDMTGLKEASLPSVEEIADSTFVGCYLLEKVELGGATKLGKAVFWFCSGLKSVYLPATLTSLDMSVFQYCGNLQEIEILATEAPRCGSSVFDGVSSKCKVYVPKGSGESYRNASQWKDLTIVEKGVDGIRSAMLEGEVRCRECYNVAGQRTNAPVKGLNILRMSDGSVRKTMNR